MTAALYRLPVQPRAARFELPGAADRSVVIGATGTGKTTFGAWILSRQRLDKRPWVCVDFKNEELFDMIGRDAMQDLSLAKLPARVGLYRLRVNPGEEDALEAWLWRVWSRGDIGVFCDEVGLVPQQNALRALLRQGRSKRIPIIACTQRPVSVDREVFSEASIVSVFRLADRRDYQTVRLFTADAPIDRPLPARWSYWFDQRNGGLAILRPCPPPDKIAADLKERAPRPAWRLFS